MNAGFSSFSGDFRLVRPLSVDSRVNDRAMELCLEVSDPWNQGYALLDYIEAVSLAHPTHHGLRTFSGFDSEVNASILHSEHSCSCHSKDKLCIHGAGMIRYCDVSEATHFANSSMSAREHQMFSGVCDTMHLF